MFPEITEDIFMECPLATFGYAEIAKILVNEDGYEEDTRAFWVELRRRYQPTEDVVGVNRDPKTLSYVERQDWDGGRNQAKAAA